MPVTGGEDHVSEGVERGIYNYHCYGNCMHTKHQDNKIVMLQLWYVSIVVHSLVLPPTHIYYESLIWDVSPQ